MGLAETFFWGMVIFGCAVLGAGVIVALDTRRVRTAAAGLPLPPVEASVVVELSQEETFHRFTDGLAAWWPLDTHSVGRAVSCRMAGEAGGPIEEVSSRGGATRWGTVTGWDPPRRLAFTWHPGRPEATAQDVTVVFQGEGDGTRVTLTHAGWEALPPFTDPVAVRGRYERGWHLALGRLQSLV